MQHYFNLEQLINFSDEDLVSECKNSEQATTILISRYAKIICKIAQARATSSIEKDDLMQEGLMGLFNAVGTFKSESGTKFSTYANVCISNKMTTALIKNNQDVKIIDYSIDDTDNDETYIFDTPESILLEKEKMQELYDKIISLLSEKEWLIFRLFLTGSTYDQMARQLNIPPKVVDNAIQRVRRKLKSVWRAENFSN